MKRIICLTMMAAMLFCSAFGIGSSATAEPGQEPDFELQPVALDASDPDYNPYAVCREITFTPVDDPNISARELGSCVFRNPAVPISLTALMMNSLN